MIQRPSPMPGGGMREYRDEAEYRASVAAFREMDANCNTCRHLVRIQHQKDPHGFLLGKCASPNCQPNPQKFPREGEAFAFHPNDHMGMTCWEGRS